MVTNGTLGFSMDTSQNVTLFFLAGSGSRAVNASAAGVLSASSDSSLKKEAVGTPIPGLAEILKIQPKAYQWLDDIAIRGKKAAVEIGFRRLSGADYSFRCTERQQGTVWFL